MPRRTQTIHLAVLLTIMTMVCLSGCRTFQSQADLAQKGVARDLTLHGLTALHRGKSEQAESLLKQAAEVAPEDARVRQHLAHAMTRCGRLEQAEKELRTAIELCHGDPRLHVDLGKLYLLKLQPRLAIAQSDLALELNRQLAPAWALKGDALRMLGDEQSALDCYHMAAAYESDDCASNTQLAIAEVYNQTGDHFKALAALDVYAKQFAPDQVPMDALFLEGKTLVALKQYGTAIAKLDHAAQQETATPRIWLELSRAQQLNGDTSNARLTALTARQKFPSDESIRMWSDNLLSAKQIRSPVSAAR